MIAARPLIVRLAPGRAIVVNRAAPGPAGGGGGSSAPFEYVQSVANATWTVNHNLGWRPLVTILSVGGSEVDATVTHTSVNQFVVTFNQPFAGKAIAR